MKRVLLVVGSLRTNSYNHQAAKEVETMLAGKAEVSYLEYGDLPFMNQDLEATTVPALDRVRKEVLVADAIWIISPVYNQYIPGPVKNLLDWLSRSLDPTDSRGDSAIHGKVVTVSCVAASGQEKVFAQYQELLGFMRTEVVGQFTSLAIKPEDWGTGTLTITDEELEALHEQSGEIMKALV